MIIIYVLLIAGFLLKILPIMGYARVGGDPFVHFRYAMALLDGKLSAPVEVNGPATVELYYPPLFHLISLVFFLAFPTIDPYSIMKSLAVTFGILQIVPIYFIVRRITHWSPAALLASYSLLSVRSDYQMLGWGGYANIMGLFLIATLVYFVMTERLILSTIVSAAIALTHHLSFLVILSVLIPYFAISVWKKKAVPKSLIGLIIGGSVAYVLFYQFALFQILDFYSKFSPVYNQSLYVTPFILEQVGPLLLLFGAIGFTLCLMHEGRRFAYGREVIIIWAIVPLFLAYAYLFGVQWHGVRWIHFIPQPLMVWTGIGLGYLRNKKYALLTFVLVFAIQLVATLLGYQSDILRNISQ